MDAGGCVMDAGTRPISLSCGETRGALRQRKMLVVARQDLCGGKERGSHKGGAAAEGGRPLFVEAAEGRLPCFLQPQRSCPAATDIMCCHSAHLVPPHERSVVPQHPSPILQHPSPILQHPSAYISMHHPSSSIHQHASYIEHHAACILYHPSCMIMYDGSSFEDFYFFENFKGALEMTARLGKALREGSWAEPAHEGVEYAHFSQNLYFPIS